jgi:hypothetical protein
MSRGEWEGESHQHRFAGWTVGWLNHVLAEHRVGQASQIAPPESFATIVVHSSESPTACR